MEKITSPSRAMQEAAIKELKKRASRRSLSEFVLYTTPGYLMGWVHKEICDVLEQFYADVEAKKSPRLIITMPPRSGKSLLVSRAFPAWLFGRNPDLQIIATSYSADLAQRFSRDVQRIMDDEPYRMVFPDARLSDRKNPGYIRTAELFELVDHKGSYRSCGVGGGITGQGADVLIIDDPVKDRADANSKTIRDKIWDWYTSTAYTRLSPGAGVIVMATRWHLDDVIGRLITAMDAGEGDTFKVINYPAIAEHDEPHRKAGEALHPERYDVKALEAIRRTIGERDWAALYQQHPIPDGGGVFKASWIRHWTNDTLPERFDQVIQSWDMTFKDTDGSDYVVGQVWGIKRPNFYLLDQIRGRMDFVATIQAVKNLTSRHPNAVRKLIEDKANGPAVISMLRKETPGIVPITPKDSKEARAYAITAFWEGGNVYIPPPELYPWVKREYIPELLEFPVSSHDDQVDAMTQALSHFSRSMSQTVSEGNKRYLTQVLRRR